MHDETKRIVLASKSPRRRRLLAHIGVEFSTIAPEVDEEAVIAPTASALAARRALLKAEAGARLLLEQPDAERTARAAKDETRPRLVIGADTIVVHAGQVLGKPADAADARRMLRQLSGTTHKVMTGLAVCQTGGGCEKDTAMTEVTFRSLAPAEIDGYVATGEPLDKAGAYGIQGKGALLVRGIRGDYFNVVGLPLTLLASLLQRFNVSLL